jgi:hypothetical protein
MAVVDPPELRRLRNFLEALLPADMRAAEVRFEWRRD